MRLASRESDRTVEGKDLWDPEVRNVALWARDGGRGEVVPQDKPLKAGSRKIVGLALNLYVANERMPVSASELLVAICGTS